MLLRRVLQLCCGPGDETVVSGGYDQAVRVWDMRSRSFDPIQSIKAFADSVTAVLVTERCAAGRAQPGATGGSAPYADAAVQPPRGSVHVRAPRERQGRGIPCTPRVCAALVCMCGWHGAVWQRRPSALALVHRIRRRLHAAGLGYDTLLPAPNPVAKQAAGPAQGGDRCSGRAVGPHLRVAMCHHVLSVPESIQLPAQGGDRGGQRGRQRALL